MFDRQQLQRVIGLQDRAYRFVLWASHLSNGEQLRAPLGRHTNLGAAEAGAEWVRRHRSVVPNDIAPAKEDIDAFASLVAGLLQTSFDVEGAGIGGQGCSCAFCSVLGKPPRLRTPSPNDRSVVHALKMLAVTAVADDLGLPLLRSEIDAMISAADAPAEEIAWLAYAQELLRRSEFASQGAGVLHLWRQIAWDDPMAHGRVRIKEGFTLSAERVALARQRVTAYVIDSAARLGEPTSEADACVVEAQLRQRSEALIAEIKTAFAGVSRAGGVSWSESDAIDGYADQALRDAARARDRDTFWEQVLADPNWTPEAGFGSFAFLDSIGTRYYLPAAMCWGLMRPEYLDTLIGTFQSGKCAPLNQRQSRCCARYIELCRDRALLAERELGMAFCSAQWQDLLNHGWSRWLGDTRATQ